MNEEAIIITLAIQIVLIAQSVVAVEISYRFYAPILSVWLLLPSLAAEVGSSMNSSGVSKLDGFIVAKTMK